MKNSRRVRSYAKTNRTIRLTPRQNRRTKKKGWRGFRKVN